MRHEVQTLADGWRGTDQTIRKINSMVNQSLLDPVVVTTAQNLVRPLPERDKDAEIERISNYVRSHIRYTNESVETLKTPRLMLDEIRKYGRAVGDCDDHVLLWAALHKAVGNPVRFKVVSQRQDGVANHIYGEVYSPTRGWVADDLIVKNQPLGWSIPAREVTQSKTYSGMGDYLPRPVRRSRMKKYITVLPVGPADYMEKRGTQMMYAERTYPQIRVPGSELAWGERYMEMGGLGWPFIKPPTSTSAESKKKKVIESVTGTAKTIRDFGALVSTGMSFYDKYKETQAKKRALKKERARRRAEAAADQKAFLEQDIAYSPYVEAPPAPEGIPTSTLLLVGGGLLAALFVLPKLMK